MMLVLTACESSQHCFYMYLKKYELYDKKKGMSITTHPFLLFCISHCVDLFKQLTRLDFLVTLSD